MHTMIYAHSVSQHSLALQGEFYCHSRYPHAINFVNSQQQLLTLQVVGKGLSPMGWQFSLADFNQFALHCTPCLRIILNSQQIEFASFKLIAKNLQPLYAVRGIKKGFTELDPFFTLLSNQIQTGLYGALNQFKQIALLLEIQQLQQAFLMALQGKSVDFSAFLGKGKGLTPSSDDMLLGMMFAFYCCLPCGNLTKLFQNTPHFSHLTTLVSQQFLTYAQSGIFSSLLVNLSQKLHANLPIWHELRQILAVGNTSGADSLFGIWLGYQVLKHYINQEDKNYE